MQSSAPLGVFQRARETSQVGGGPTSIILAFYDEMSVGIW